MQFILMAVMAPVAAKGAEKFSSRFVIFGGMILLLYATLQQTKQIHRYRRDHLSRPGNHCRRMTHQLYRHRTHGKIINHRCNHSQANIPQGKPNRKHQNRRGERKVTDFPCSVLGFTFGFMQNSVAAIATCLAPIYMSLFLQDVLGMDSMQAGLSMFLPSILMAVMAHNPKISNLLSEGIV